MAFIRVEGGGGNAPMTKEELWANANPTANYTSGTVTLSEPIENFKYIEFTFTNEADVTIGGNTSGLYTPAKVKQNPQNDTGGQCCVYTLQTGSAPYKFRAMYIPSADASLTEHSRIHFDPCRTAGSDTTYPNRLMPYKIFGYR